VGAVRWDRLAALRTPLLMILALVVLTGGVGTGMFLICLPAGWITVGILGAAGLAFLAWVTDDDSRAGPNGVRR